MQFKRTLVSAHNNQNQVKAKTIQKRSSQKEKKFVWIFIEIVENWKPLGYDYKCTRQDVFLHTYSPTAKIILKN